jgi:4-hydroxy-tetrahydrodipicolinate reductase
MKKYKVIEWTTGGVGSAMVGVMRNHPELELVGVYAYSPEKVGKDVGTLCGFEPIGIKATSDVDALLALKADCVNYVPIWPNIDELCRILESGLNVVTAASWITGHKLDAEYPHPSGKKARQLIEEACQRGKSTIYGSGMSPGLDNILGLVCTSACSHVDHLTVTESVDVSCHHSPETWKSVGYGLPVNHPDVPKLVKIGTSVFVDALYMMADGLGVQIEEVRFENEVGAATEDTDFGWWQIKKGCVASQFTRWIGIVNGKPMIEQHLVYQMGFKTDPCWKVEHGYLVAIKGYPDIKVKYSIFPPRGTSAKDTNEYQRIGMTVTGMPVLNAIKEVCKAKPGILTSPDISVRGLTASARRP